MNSFVWQGKDSYIDFGIVINVLPPEIIPEEDTEEIEIKGRDGNLTIDYNAKKSYTLPMECTLLDFTKIDEIKAWLSGSGDLTFNWSNYKYNARLNNKIDISQSLETFGEFPLIWKVQPYKLSTANALITLIDFTNSNLVINDDFSNGTTGWTAASASTHSAANNTLSNTGDGTTLGPTEGQTASSLTAVVGNKLYLKYKHRVTNTVCVSIHSYLYAGSAVYANQHNTPTQNIWYTDSGIITEPVGWSGPIGIYIDHNYADAATASGKVMELQEVMLIDLTAIYGAGNEPTQAWCDANIIFDSHSGVIFNPSTETSKPTVKVYGTGTINLTITMQGKNLFDGILDVGGYNGSNGAIVAAPTWRHSANRVIIKPNTTYTLSHVGTETRYIFGYDDSDVFISFTGSGTYTTASNCKYIRICFDGSGMTNIQLEEGVATAYEKYISNSTAIALTNVVDYVTINSELMDAYKGTILKNNDMVGEFFELLPGDNIINWAGDVNKIEVTGNWRYL